MNKEIIYEVRLKYVKKVKLPILREQKLAEFFPVFESNKKNKRNIVGKVEVRTRVFLPEFVTFAKRVGFSAKILYPAFKVEGSKILIQKKINSFFCDDDYAYLRLMIFGVVMAVLKSPAEWGRLEDHLLSMEPIPLRYWASRFKSVYWKYKDQKKLRFLAKRFLEVEWI